MVEIVYGAMHLVRLLIFGLDAFFPLLLGGLIVWLAVGIVKSKLRFRPSTAHRSSSSYSRVPKPKTLYHGTTRENAFDIYNTGLWLVGHTRPHAIWMGDRIDIARRYSRRKGAIVVVDVDPGLRLTPRGRGVYSYEILGGVPKKEYYRIQGLTPISLLDPRGNRIV